MPNTKNNNSNAPVPNPAKQIQTPRLPTKQTRDDGHKVIINTPKGEKK